MKAFSIYGAPGCGKTTTLMRVVSKLKDEGYAPEDIAFISHTRAAAEEALSRLGLSKSPNVCTIHSMAFRLLGMSSVQVVDHRKLQQFAKAINIPITGKAHEEDERSVGDDYMDVIGYAKNRKLDVLDSYLQSDRPGSLNQFKMFAEGYESWKHAYGYKDFNDMLLDCLAERKHPQVKALIIDEAQDLSIVQWDIIDMFLEDGEIDRVYIAGDDDQAVNSWAGAEPDGMRKFEEKYDAHRHVLEKSYRLPENIHSLANKVIADTPNRVNKHFDHNGPGGNVVFCGNVWRTNLKHGDDTMVLARTHRELKEMEEYFIKKKLPYTKKGGQSYYENRFAAAARIHQAMKKGHLPNEKEISLLDRVGTSIGKKLINNLDFTAYSAAPLNRVVMLPYSLENYYMATDFNQKPTIRLSTMHASKGHEADVVVVNTHLPDMILKNWDKVWEEETRLMYVALTRSRRGLYVIIHPDGFKFNRYHNSNQEN